MMEHLNIFYALKNVRESDYVRNQAKWWVLITILMLCATIIPAGILSAKNRDIIEIAEGFLISIGIRAIASFSKLIIENMFKIINESKLSYYVRGCKFFNDESPLEQYMAERSLRHQARASGIEKRRNQMASHPTLWFILIVCSFLVRLTPDVLGAGLIAQTFPKRYPEMTSTIDNTFLWIPDLIPEGNDTTQEHLTLRGNCVWTRKATPSSMEIGEGNGPEDSYGFTIWQYCVDIIRYHDNDLEQRTLTGNLFPNDNDTECPKQPHFDARFHLELITKDFFTESWVPFESKSVSQQYMNELLDEVISNGKNICKGAEECVNRYPTVDEKITYLLLNNTRMKKRSLATLSGDNGSRKSVLNAVGQVKHRLTSATRVAFILLVVSVALFSLIHGISNSREVNHILLHRAIAEVRNEPGVSFDTAIAMPKTDVLRRWVLDKRITCYIEVDDKLDVKENKPSSFIPDEGVDGNPVVVVVEGKQLVKGTIKVSRYSFTSNNESVDFDGATS